MKSTKITDIEEKENPHGVSVRTIYDHDAAQAVHILLRPGERLKKHITPVDVFFYVLEGRGQVEIGEELEVVEKDTIVESPARVPHRLINPYGEDFRFLVVKAPRQSEKSKIL